MRSLKFLGSVCIWVIIVCLLAANANAVISYNIDKDPGHVLYGNLNQNNLPAPLGAVACGPVAVTNSYRYLENKYPGVYGNNLTNNNLAQTATNLAALMNTVAFGGTFWDDLIWYKMTDIENKVPGVTTYNAQRNPIWQWGVWNNAGAIEPSWVTPILPTWGFIWNELSACADVEVLLSFASGGHYLTVKSFHWNDVDEDDVIDFEENATFDYIDPCTGAPGVSGIWQSYKDAILETNYGSGGNITMAVSEIPEPCTILLLGLGSWLLRKRRV